MLSQSNLPPSPPPTELPGCHERLLRSPVAGPARRGGGPGARGSCGGKWLKSPWGCFFFFWRRMEKNDKKSWNMEKNY